MSSSINTLHKNRARSYSNIHKVVYSQIKGPTLVQVIHATSHVTFYCFFLCPMSFLIRILLRHVTFYNILYMYGIYIIIIFYKVSISSSSTIKFQPRFYNIYKILTSLSTVFYQGSSRILELLKWSCCTSFFTYMCVEP